MESLEATLLVLLGWLLGILGGPIAERLRRRYSADALTRALGTELRELRYTMASTVHLLSQRLGTLDHPTLDWFIAIEQQYQGPDKDPAMLPALQKLRAQPAQQLAAAMALQTPLQGLSLKQSGLPFLESRLSELSILDLELQQRLLQVKEQLSIFNQEVAFLNEQFALTFQPGLGANHAVVSQNLQQGYQKLAPRARRLADAVTALCSLQSMSRSAA